jgi:predicted Zn-dependent protease
MRGEEALRRIATQALEATKADEAEVVLSANESALTRFANSTIHQNVFEAGVEVRVRAVLGTRIGVATTTRTDERSLREIAERALESARYAPENPEFKGLPAPQPITPVSAYSSATASYSPERRARDVKGVCDEAIGHGLNASGAWSTSEVELAVANTHGVWGYDARTHASFKTVVMGDDSSGYAERTAVDATTVDVGATGREAIDKAVRSKGPVHLDPGDYTTVLEPYAVGTMVDYLAYIGLGALSAQEGRSFMNGHFGEQIVGENITLWDDGLDPSGVPMSFDFEGVPKRRVTFFDQGIAREVVYDSFTAGREGKRSTGHALPAPNSYGPMPLHLFLAAGDADRTALLAGIERGLWVTRFHYVNVVHPTRAILTGMTRDGTFLIEHGEITRPVHNLRFTQSVLDALSNVEAIGREPMMLQDEVGGTHVPPLRVGKFTFTSATQF